MQEFAESLKESPSGTSLCWAGCGGLIKQTTLIGNSSRCQACAAPIYNLALKHRFLSSCLISQYWKVSVTMVSACSSRRTKHGAFPSETVQMSHEKGLEGWDSATWLSIGAGSWMGFKERPGLLSGRSFSFFLKGNTEMAGAQRKRGLPVRAGQRHFPGKAPPAW